MDSFIGCLFAFWVLWMHCTAYLGSMDVCIAPAGKSGGSFFVAVVLGSVIYLYQVGSLEA